MASPVWLLMLLVLPRAGLSPVPAFILATLVTAALAWVGVRWFLPRPAAGPGRPRTPGLPLDGTGRWLLGALAVVVVLYVLFALNAGG